MRALLTYLLILYSFSAFAQNYNCLQAGVKNYFINGNNYVRGIRIDSTTASGSNLIFYPYHSLRIHNYLPTPLLASTETVDSSGASWLGKKVIRQADGTFLFDNLWDTVIIKSLANTGDSWMFFNDTTRYSYTATVTSEGTMTILGAIDSIKTITITADSSGINRLADPVNNFQIILSKNNGFVQVFDLYTFPYHKPDTVSLSGSGAGYYLRNFDYYLDVVLNNLGTCDVGCSDNLPDTINSIFHLFSFHNPTTMEIYNFSIGDVYESELSVAATTPPDYNLFTLDSIFTKTTMPSSTTCSGTEHRESTTLVLTGYVVSWDTTLFPVTGYSAFGDTSLLIDTNLMPEEHNAGFLFHYYPDYLPGVFVFDCDSPASYEIDKDFAGTGFGYNDYAFVPSYYSNTYSIGFGMSAMSAYDAPVLTSYSQSYIYYVKNDTTCGGFFPIIPLGIPPVNSEDQISIYPSPASDHIDITAANQSFDNVFINVYDMSGKCLFHSIEDLHNSLTINTSTWIDGLYMIVIQDNEGILMKKKIEIMR